MNTTETIFTTTTFYRFTTKVQTFMSIFHLTQTTYRFGYVNKKDKEVKEKRQVFKYFQERPKIKKPIGVRIPIINEKNSKCLWKFIHHCSYNYYISKQQIKCHDIVYFQHISQKGLVASTLANKNYSLKA